MASEFSVNEQTKCVIVCVCVHARVCIDICMRTCVECVLVCAGACMFLSIRVCMLFWDSDGVRACVHACLLACGGCIRGCVAGRIDWLITGWGIDVSINIKLAYLIYHHKHGLTCTATTHNKSVKS